MGQHVVTHPPPVSVAQFGLLDQLMQTAPVELPQPVPSVAHFLSISVVHGS
jgi:hypothetical protein